MDEKRCKNCYNLIKESEDYRIEEGDIVVDIRKCFVTKTYKVRKIRYYHVYDCDMIDLQANEEELLN